MLKKFLKLFFLTIFLSHNALATLPSKELTILEESLEDFIYFATVEWDQQDLTVLENQVRLFSQKLEEIKDHLSPEEIEMAITSQMDFDKDLLEHLRSEIIPTDLESQVKWLQWRLKSTALTGTSWTGREAKAVLAGVSVLALITILIIATSKGDCQRHPYWDACS